jgi:hypothetical protein
MPNQTESARLTAALQQNSAQLIAENMLEVWAYRNGNRALKLSVTHVVNPRPDGSYGITSKIGFGIHIVHGVTSDLARAETTDRKLAAFPRGNAVAAA